MYFPSSITEKWSKPEYDSLRQAVLVFGGHITQEIVITFFTDVSLNFLEEEEGETSIKGVFYFTSQRFIFLPKNQIPHPHLVQCPYESIRALSGTRSSLTISIVDSQGASAHFQLQVAQSLFQCFNLLRSLAEAVRLTREDYLHAVLRQVNLNTYDETPFSSLEIELPDFLNKKTNENNLLNGISNNNNNNNKTTSTSTHSSHHSLTSSSQAKEDPIVTILAPMKNFFDYCNSLHFDIHLKLRFIFVTSFVSFALKYMPFIPFLALSTSILIFSRAWIYINKNQIPKESKMPIPQQASGFVRSQRFVSDWLLWRNPKKSLTLMTTTFMIFVSWAVLPTMAFAILFAAIYFYVFLRPLKLRKMKSLLSGYWFST